MALTSITEVTDQDMVRLWGRVNPVASGCWEWTAHTVDGYGVWRLGERMLRVHRVMLGLATGRLGVMACHHCDNRKCVNPAHLYWGDAKTNIEDQRERAGLIRPCGDANHKAKLVADDVRFIRRNMGRAGWNLMTLARKYGVTPQAIWRVVQQKTWKTAAA